MMLREGYSGQQDDIGAKVENQFEPHFHYQLARNVGQLEPLRCVVHPARCERYLQQCRQHRMVEGISRWSRCILARWRAARHSGDGQ